MAQDILQKGDVGVAADDEELAESAVAALRSILEARRGVTDHLREQLSEPLPPPYFRDQNRGHINK